MKKVILIILIYNGFLYTMDNQVKAQPKKWKELITHYFDNYLNAAVEYLDGYYITKNKSDKDQCRLKGSCSKSGLEKYMTIAHVDSEYEALKKDSSAQIKKQSFESLKKLMTESYRIFLMAHEDYYKNVVKCFCKAVYMQETNEQKIVAFTLRNSIIGAKVLAKIGSGQEAAALVIAYPTSLNDKKGAGKVRAQALVNALAATDLSKISYNPLHEHSYMHQLIPNCGLFIHQGIMSDRLDPEHQGEDEHKMGYFDREGVYYNKDLIHNSGYYEKSPYQLENPFDNKRRLLALIQSSGDCADLADFYSALEFGGDPEVVNAGYDALDEIDDYITYKKEYLSKRRGFLKSKVYTVLVSGFCLGAGLISTLVKHDSTYKTLARTGIAAASMAATFVVGNLLKRVLLRYYKNDLYTIAALERSKDTFKNNCDQIFEEKT